MVSAILTIALVVLALMRWIKWDGALGGRVMGSLFCLVAVAFIWFLNSWNFLGWNY